MYLSFASPVWSKPIWKTPLAIYIFLYCSIFIDIVELFLQNLFLGIQMIRLKGRCLLWLCRKVGSSKNSSFNFYIIMWIQTLTNTMVSILPLRNYWCQTPQHPTETEKPEKMQKQYTQGQKQGKARLSKLKFVGNSIIPG